MGRLDVIVPDDIEKELRVRAAQLFGGERGALSKAVAEAIRLWLQQKAATARKQ